MDTPQPTTPSQISDKSGAVAPGPGALRALAHPVRMRMLGLLRLDGPATATRLAQRLDINSGATSYHLRQLAQHGFITEDGARGNGRERWWRARHESTYFMSDDADGDALEAGNAFTQAALSVQIWNAQQAIQEYLELPFEWRRSSTTTDYTFAMTPTQAKDLTDRLHALLEEAISEAPSLTSRPEGTELFTVQLQTFPQPGRITPQSLSQDKNE